MKILFLDVDGVLNAFGHTKERSPQGTLGVDRGLANQLSRVVNETGCKLVLSSTWRKHDDLAAYLMRELGPMGRLLIGQTPVNEKPSGAWLWTAAIRGDEIQDWLSLHPEVKQFAIVDDDADMGHLKHRLVRTHGCEGLTAEKADELIKMLS